jgi:hypothetical protein
MHRLPFRGVEFLLGRVIPEVDPINAGEHPEKFGGVAQVGRIRPEPA